MYNFNLNSYSSTLSDLFHDLIRSFENHKWSENGPEVISEGLNSKFSGGHAPRPPLRLHCRTQSLCPPPQNVLFCPAPLIHLKTFAALSTHHAWFTLTGIYRLTFCLFFPSSFFLFPTSSFPLFLSTSFLSPTFSLLPHLTSFLLSFPPLLLPSLPLSPYHLLPPSLLPSSLPHSSPECPSI